MAEHAASPFMGLPTLMQMAFSEIDLTPMSQELLERSQVDPDDGNALMDLSIIMHLRGDSDLALALQAEALRVQRTFRLPAATDSARLRLLAIMTSGELMANTPLEFLVQNSDVALELLYVEHELPPAESAPPHDLLFVAVGESDRTRSLLRNLDAAVASWPRPVLNQPGRIAQLSRDGVCDLLSAQPGIDLPVSFRVDRATLENVGRDETTIEAIMDGEHFPIIIRPVDSHAGRGLTKLEGPESLGGYLKTLRDREFFVARFVNYQGKDGFFRKFRIVFIEGHPFVAHMAISEHWMIHYLNAGMGESEAKREEEARFMATFDEDFAVRHASALTALVDRVGLDYFGIDCAETQQGELLIFEVDSALVVHAMDPVEIYPYKIPNMQRIFGAFREMLLRRAKPDSP